MFEPGQKVIVTESNVRRKTGPRVGSIGFVSNSNVYPHGIWFNKIVWYRYGNQEKCRMETSTFAMLHDKKQKFSFQKHGLSRSGGQLEPIRDKRAVEDMDDLEFMCWLYSVLRVGYGQKCEEARRIAGFVNFSPANYRTRQHSSDEKFALALTARMARNSYHKADIELVRNELNACRDRVDYLTNIGWRPDRIVKDVMLKAVQWHDHFCTLFARMEFASVSGKVAERWVNKGVQRDEIIKRMRVEWQRQNGIIG